MTTHPNALRPLHILATAVALLGLVGADHARADPFSSSESRINDIRTSTPPESIGTTSSSVDDGHNSASSFLLPAHGTMGARTASDGSVFSVVTSSRHDDDWSCSGNCSVAGPLRATIGFEASFSGPGTIGEFDLSAQYRVGSFVFSIDVSQDGGPPVADAALGIDPVDVILTFDQATNTFHVSTHVVGLTFPTSCSTANGPCGLFSDSQWIAIEMEGPGFVDASHTFTVSLETTNPDVFLTSADGRTAGAPVDAVVPEPETMLLFGIGIVAFVAERRRVRSSA